MKRATVFIAVLLISGLGADSSLWAQSHLLLIPSPQVLGRGGVNTPADYDDPLAALVNPGMLGLMADRDAVSFGFYPSRTRADLPFSENMSLSYYARSMNAGFSRRMLSKFFDGNSPVSVGFSCHEVRLEFPPFSYLDEQGHVLSTHDSFEDARGFSVGAAIHGKHVQLGVGWSNRWVRMNWGAPDHKPKCFTNDVGFVAQSYLMDRLWKPLSIGSSSFLHSFIRPSLSYALSNLGPSYSSGDRRSPQPRRDALTLSLAVGASMDLPDGESLQVISLEAGERVGDNLVRPGEPDGGTYRNPLIDIQPFNDLILGKYHRDIYRSKGFEFSLCEIAYLRYGSVENEHDPWMPERYNTSGWGMSATGIMKYISSSLPPDANGVLRVIVRHLDLQYDVALREEVPDHTFDGAKFQQVVLRWRS